MNIAGPMSSAWSGVMFISKDGEDTFGWVPRDRLKAVGQYGRNP